MSIDSPLSPKSDGLAPSTESFTPAKNQRQSNRFSLPISDEPTREKIRSIKPNLIASATTDKSTVTSLSTAGKKISDKPHGPTMEKTNHEKARINQPLQPINWGMDKVFYHVKGDRLGFLDTKPEIKERELEAYTKLVDTLKGTGVRVPEVIDDRTTPAPIVKKKGTGDIARAEGYWIEFIPNMINFKPITAAISTLANDVGRQNNPVKLYQRFIKEGKHKEAENLKTAFKALLENCEKICSLVGEVTLGINRETGDVFLVDVAPNMGNTAAEQADKIESGLTNLYNLMKD